MGDIGLSPEAFNDLNSKGLHKVHLTGEKATLLIPLYAKALDSHSKHSILNDEKSAEIIQMIDYDFEKLKRFGNGNIMVVRAKQYDEWIREFLISNPDGVVLNLGCGLDTRISRINPPSTVSWFDVDFPEVIDERQKFYSNQAGYEMLASSITESKWLQKIQKGKPVIVIADGVFAYLTEEQVKELLNRITDYFPCGQIAFDVMNSYAVKMGKNRLREISGGEHRWAAEDIKRVDELDPKLKRKDTLTLLGSKYLPLKYRLLFGVALILPRYKNMMRLLRYWF